MPVALTAASVVSKGYSPDFWFCFRLQERFQRLQSMALLVAAGLCSEVAVRDH